MAVAVSGIVMMGRKLGASYGPCILVLLFSGILVVAPVSGEPPTATCYVTTPFLEPDRCATSWVVHRFVDPDAVFEFHERGTTPQGCILYDLPEAEIKRDARRATVEVLIELNGVDDPLARRLGSLIHDIEINAWAHRRVPGSLAFQQ